MHAISLGVTFFYMNVVEQLVIESIKKRYVDICKIYKIPKNEIIKGVKLIIRSTSFSFTEKYYLQVYGLPIVGPCSTIDDIVMDGLETECLSKLDFTPIAYYRYIDDIFAIIPARQNRAQFVSI